MSKLYKIFLIPVISLTLLINCTKGESNSTNSNSDDNAKKSQLCNSISAEKQLNFFNQLGKLETANSKLMDLFYTNINTTSLTYGLTSNEIDNVKGIMLVENSNVLVIRTNTERNLKTIVDDCSKNFMTYSDVKTWYDFMNQHNSQYVQVLISNYGRISNDIQNQKFKDDFGSLYKVGIVDNATGLDKIF